jgi:hypothetical protein
MPRFVVLRHDMPPGAARPSHWDVMFERGEALRTWAVEASPELTDEQEALALPDHRLAYLDYEGAVSGDRGTVARWDEGTYDVLEKDDKRFVARIAGRRLEGTVSLTFDERWTYRLTPTVP